VKQAYSSDPTKSTPSHVSDLNLARTIRDFSYHKDFLIACSRQLVTDSKSMVRGATRSAREFLNSLQPSISTLCQIFDTCETVLKSMWEINARLTLIDSVLDATELFRSTALAAASAAGKDQGDPDMETLMRQATCLAETLANHMKIVKMLDFRNCNAEDIETERL
jgi:hypothetical protein